MTAARHPAAHACGLILAFYAAGVVAELFCRLQGVGL